MVFLNYWYLEVLAVLVTIILFVVSRMKRHQQYWKQKGVPYVEPKFPFGNFGNPITREEHLGIIIQTMYKEFKRMGAKHGGMYSFLSPIYVPVDPDILKNIMQKEFSYFQDRAFYYNEKDEPLTAHLFAISGPKWRHLRTTLTPTFTSGKMKMMFETVVQSAHNMHEAMIKYEESNEGIDIKDILAKYTTDVIGSCAFGLDCNSFQNEQSEFRKYGKEIFKRMSGLETLKNVLIFAKPDLARKLGITIFSKEMNAFFINVIKDTVKYREENNVKRNDMLQLLIDVKNDSDRKSLTVLEIAAQAFVFFTAGFETSSTTMTFCLYELANNPNIQEKVRNEINSVLDKHGGKITYEAIMEMKYMSQVVEETLRKYPPLAFVTRSCVEDYCVPETDVVIEKNTRVFIPIYALHHDEDYFPKPEQFDPNRFSDENRSTIRPFTYIPFGEGPRICIGMRFGIMQTKVGLTVMLRNYIISLNKKTVSPLNLDRFSFILTATEGVWLNIKSVQEPS